MTNMKGKWFHTIKDGKIQYQGRILGEFKGAYNVQLYEFITGTATDQLIFPIDKHEFKFYNSDKEMRNYYEEQNGFKKDSTKHPQLEV